MSLSTVPKGSVLALTARVARDSMARRPSSPSAAESETVWYPVSARRGESLVAVKKIQFFNVNRCMLALATCHRPPQPHPDPAQHHRSL